MSERKEVSRYLALRGYWDRAVREKDERSELYLDLSDAWHRLTAEERRTVGAHCVIEYH